MNKRVKIAIISGVALLTLSGSAFAYAVVNNEPEQVAQAPVIEKVEAEPLPPEEPAQEVKPQAVQQTPVTQEEPEPTPQPCPANMTSLKNRHDAYVAEFEKSWQDMLAKGALPENKEKFRERFNNLRLSFYIGYKEYNVAKQQYPHC